MPYAIKTRGRLLLLALLLVPNLFQAAQKSAEQLLEDLDRVRLPARSFVVDLTIADYRQGRKEREGMFRLYSRRTSNGFDSLAVCLAPQADRYKLLLSRGEQLWFYDPRSARPVPVSPTQFRSHSFLLDLFGAPLSGLWIGQIQGDGKTMDLARREITARQLRLTSSARAKAGSTISYWLDKDTNRPLKSEVFAANGKLLRAVYYADFRNALGEQRPMRIVVADSVENSVSEVRFSGFSHHEVPEILFDETQLPTALSRLK